jgi:hypothetical protein
MKIFNHFRNIKFRWYWCLCAVPIFLGIILIALAISGYISDWVAEDGRLIEDGYRTFLLGYCLIKHTIIMIIIIIFSKKICKLYRYLKLRFF